MNSNNPRGAGRKTLPANQKTKPVTVSMHPAMLEFVKRKADENLTTASEYIRSIIVKEMKKEK